MSRERAADRVERILAVLPYIVANGGASLSELSQRFSVDETQLVKDLNLVFTDVGVHPFTPDTLVDVFIDGDHVTVELGDYFRRPLRLSAEEGLFLLTAGRAVLARPGDQGGPLERAVLKLEAVLGAGATSSLNVDLGSADPVVLEAVDRAVREHRQLVIEYYSHGRDEASRRTVDPWHLFSDSGHWYLLGYCHEAADERHFRVDRITSAVVTDAEATVPDEDISASLDLTGVARQVELVVPPEARWVPSTYPCDEVDELPDGRLRIVLPVTATPWLERLLLRLGPGVEAVDLSTGRRWPPS